jgi:para-aminobenzoate synthetase/4-amino-4-deoxychorismate lyase
MIIFGDKLFTNPIKVIKAFNKTELLKSFEQIEKLKNDFFIVGYLRYDAFEAIKSEFPLLYFEVFKNFTEYKPFKNDVSKVLPQITAKPQVSFEEYSNAIAQIKDEISQGNTYEVNYTYDFDVERDCGDFELFEYLLEKQKTPYNFYMKNDYDTVLSFSPELFFSLKDKHILTKPMKGTIKRSQNVDDDKKLIEFLKNDEKNRAENVMIVDLLRNDLGRIAKTGSVKVSKLFEIETHKTLHQMTSQIEADLKNDVKLYDIFKAIFPCGSITGAPKISTMRIIDKIEKGSRDIYCGAIGMISPTETLFSVPIRILQRKNNQQVFKYRVGGAIVWNSDTQDEWEETLTKTKFLNESFQIIETIKIENGKFLYEKEHFERLSQSAQKLFGKNIDEFEYTQKLTQAQSTLRSNCAILRILLNQNCQITTQIKPFEPQRTNKITISPIVIDSKNELMYHKTTYRPWFFDSYQKIAKGEIYDEIFFNEKGELTEGARSNVILQIGGKLYTPPVSCGLLDGVGKKFVKNLNERILYKSDLENAEKIFCINSVRGVVEVKL